MVTQRAVLLEHLPRFGWELVAVQDADLDWWADEVWVLESSWSPAGCRVYLTFLIDLMADRERKKGQQVWAVGASFEWPTDPGLIKDRPMLYLGHHWREQLPGFLNELSELRHQLQ